MAGIESLLVGRVLGGRYRIEEVIGRGGMGAVYRAVDERLGRQVALKVITVGDSGDAEGRERLRARFFREARSAAALPHHPNVVPVYDYGSDGEVGLDYIVMELLRGSDLASRLSRGGPPPLAASLKILLEAARGVAVGHRQGLIHRDIKPGNIFLTEPHRNEVQVRVVDFGIAKVADDEDTLSQLTQDGRVPHSPAYASPEQIRGLGQLTPASDVFSLGAVAFQLLTGERPFTDSDRNRMSLGMAVDVPSLRQRNPAVPGPIEAAVQKALAFDPRDRFPDAGAFATELERAVRSLGDQTVEPYLSGAAIVTATDSAPPASSRALDDDRTRVMDSDFDDRTLLAPPPAAAAPAARLSTRRAPPAPPPVASQPRRSGGAGRVFVWTMFAALLGAGAFWLLGDRGDGPAATVQEQPPPPDSVDIIVPQGPIGEPPEPTELDAYVANQEGIRFFQQGDFTAALNQFEQAVEIAPLNADYRRNYGLALLRVGEPGPATVQLQRAIALAPDRPDAYETLSRALLAAGDTTAAIDALDDYLARETRAAQRGVAERRRRDLEAAAEPQLPPLLGDQIEDDSVLTAPAVDSVPAVAPQ